jgi:hypothetical protein
MSNMTNTINAPKPAKPATNKQANKKSEPADDDNKSEEEEAAIADQLTPFPLLMVSLIQSMHMSDHHPEDEDTVVEAAKIHLKGQLLTFGCHTDDDFDDAFADIMGEYCCWFRQLSYVASDNYDEEIDIDGYQINLLDVDDVILSQETRTLLEEQQNKQEPNFYGEMEAGIYMGNKYPSDEWEETREKRKLDATRSMLDISEYMVECLMIHIDIKGYTNKIK